MARRFERIDGFTNQQFFYLFLLLFLFSSLLLLLLLLLFSFFFLFFYVLLLVVAVVCDKLVLPSPKIGMLSKASLLCLRFLDSRATGDICQD